MKNKTESSFAVCPDCGGETLISPDPPGSRLVATCQRGECGRRVSLPIRASALSLYGVFELAIAGVVGTVGYWVAVARGSDLPITIILVLVGLVLGGGVATVLVRLVYHLCFSSLPHFLQKEFVAHLSFPSFPDQQSGKGPSDRAGK